MDNLTKALDMKPLVVEEQKEDQLPAVVDIAWRDVTGLDEFAGREKLNVELPR